MDWRSRAAYFLTVNTFPINNFYRSALHGSTNFSALLCYNPLCCRFPYSGNRREVRTWIWTLSCCQSLRALLQAVSSACWLANDSGNLSLWKEAEIKKTQRMAVRCVFFLFWFSNPMDLNNLLTVMPSLYHIAKTISSIFQKLFFDTCVRTRIVISTTRPEGRRARRNLIFQ